MRMPLLSLRWRLVTRHRFCAIHATAMRAARFFHVARVSVNDGSGARSRKDLSPRPPASMPVVLLCARGVGPSVRAYTVVVVGADLGSRTSKHRNTGPSRKDLVRRR